MDDLISRQAAIEALARTAREKFNLSDEFNHYLAGLRDGEMAIRQLPSAQPELIEREAYIRGFEQGKTQGRLDTLSAQPEQLTDKEQRIFLAAMDREEKVCRQVDDECRNCREPYEDSLVRTCHEIARKVKGALWTI